MADPKRGRTPSDDYEVLVNKGAIVIPIEGTASRRIVANDTEGERTIVLEDENGDRLTVTTTFEPANE